MYHLEGPGEDQELPRSIREASLGNALQAEPPAEGLKWEGAGHQKKGLAYGQGGMEGARSFGDARWSRIVGSGE